MILSCSKVHHFDIYNLWTHYSHSFKQTVQNVHGIFCSLLSPWCEMLHLEIFNRGNILKVHQSWLDFTMYSSWASHRSIWFKAFSWLTENKFIKGISLSFDLKVKRFVIELFSKISIFYINKLNDHIAICWGCIESR